MKVGAVGIQAAGALGAVYAVVAEAHDHLAQGLQVVAEGVTHVVRYVNDAFARLVGKEQDELAGRPFAEARLLRASDAYQRVTDWHKRTPAL